jgi:DNA-binding GntR family transcriptional regulator
MRMTAPSSLHDRPLYEQVAERLRERILAHTLPPGSWIDEQALVRDYGISRTPLREALKVLASEGLVTIRPRRGAYVTEVSERDTREVYHLLMLLESDAAAEVAAKASSEQMAELEALHARLEAAAQDRETFFALNEAFHMRLLELADNRWRVQIVADLRKVMKLNRHNSLLSEGRLAQSLQEHREVLAALRQRDAEAARALTQAHFRQGLQAARAVGTRAAGAPAAQTTQTASDCRRRQGPCSRGPAGACPAGGTRGCAVASGDPTVPWRRRRTAGPSSGRRDWRRCAGWPWCVSLCVEPWLHCRQTTVVSTVDASPKHLSA